MNINRLELETILRDSGYDILDTPLESDYDAIAAPNGGMAQIYIRDIDSKDWNDQPELSDLRSALDAFISRTYIDIVLVKYSGSDGYRVYNGSGNTIDLQTFFAGKIEYPDAVERIRGLDSTRSGDIILLAKNGWYFAEGIYRGEHGGLSQEESYIPLIFSGPTIRKGITETTPASNIDMSITLSDLLGFSMPEAEGIVLPVKELKDNTHITNPNANPAIILNDNGRARPPGTNMTRLNVTVTGSVGSVTIDLSPIGGSAMSPMTKIPGNDIYTITTSATSGINLTNNLVVNATDTSGNFNNSVSIPLTVLLRGDIVRDNKIDLKDLLYMRRYLVGKEISINMPVADIQPAEGDGKVDLKDLLYLRRYLIGKEPLI